LNYKQQLEVVKGLFVPPETELRMDCPFCLHKNVFMINTTDGGYQWYCFHASCKAKGKDKGVKNMKYVEKVLESSGKLYVENEDFKLPENFKSIYSNEKAMQWLSKNNCWEAWSWGRADFKYDVKQDRVVFLIKNRDSHKVVGAVGRGLNKNVYPKWFMYGNKDVPFKCGECDDAVIVEDCPSACAVSNILTGIAIMGTKLKDLHKSHLKPYKNLYICLDRDATAKSYDIAKDLRSSGFENIIVKPLTDDLKYYNTEQIKEIFYDRKTND